MESKWSYRFDRNDRLSGFTCVAFNLEDVNHGSAVSYSSEKGKPYAATKELLKILGHPGTREPLQLLPILTN